MRNSITRTSAMLLLVALVVALGACGKKGALYLPQKDADQPKATVPK